jgi:carbonic anhydrase
MRISRRGIVVGPALAAMLPLRALAQQHGTLIRPDEALELLRAGNRLFVDGKASSEPLDNTRRRMIAMGQMPFAAIVGCSDSRVGPEQVFARGLGELFVIRNAGSTAASPQALGSVEYAVTHLGVPLVVVLGHSKCGAVSAAAEVAKNQAELPGSIDTMVEPIVPAVLAVRSRAGDPIDNAVRENVRRVARDLRSPAQPLLAAPQRDGKLKVVGAHYDLETGFVDFFDMPSATATAPSHH